MDFATLGFDMSRCTLGFCMRVSWLPSLGVAVFWGMILGYSEDAKMSANCVSACNCVSPMSNGVAGCGFLIAPIRSNAAYAARSAEERKGIELRSKKK